MSCQAADAPASADPLAVLTDALREAIVAAFGPEHAGIDPLIRASQNPAFGDFQANVAMSLAKRLDRQPRDVAAGRAAGCATILVSIDPAAIEAAQPTDVVTTLAEAAEIILCRP